MKTVICVKDAVEPGSCGTSMAFVRPKQVRGERSRGEKGNGKEARVYKIGQQDVMNRAMVRTKISGRRTEHKVGLNSGGMRASNGRVRIALGGRPNKGKKI